ncbi:GIY-YIG catalytic domain-containing protein [Oscillibacter sp. PC13]|uniref:GIY-YIG nuclease family protein n=1 Tax=Oscillibacter sp. PC13 TaxID=1855299 RepID=UPI0008E6C979|nr:GIY-YIG nuclease family protein [Oscillibacter sp. PC13]SFP43696.1 GIY-YIG catalytic domain-containing protein [Oscillibacter sp. PC13]
MKLQELLVGKGVNLERTKLIRHNLTNEVVAENYAHGYLEIYQSIQAPTRFKNCNMVISFLGTEGTNGVFQGCYQVGSFTPYDRAKLPKDFTPDSGMTSESAIFELTRTDLLADLKDRLVIDWGKGAINWCQNGTTEKEVLAIRPAVSEISFTSYDKVLLSFEALRKIIYNKAAYKEWEEKLSAVAGVYLITDTKTGKHYVGSASGEQGGIWGRWSEYARTKHGGNKRLAELIAADAEYCNNFQYSILEVFPIKRDRHEVLEYEQLYKKKLWSIPFGLNDN